MSFLFRKSVRRACAIGLSLCSLAAIADAADFEVGSVDPLVKVFPEDGSSLRTVALAAATRPTTKISTTALGDSDEPRLGSSKASSSSASGLTSGEESYVAEVAAGEYASFQVVIRSEEAIKGLSAKVEPFRISRESGASESHTPDRLEAGPTWLIARPVRFVGYVPVDKGIGTPPKDQLRKPPARFPDPLLEAEKIDVPPRKSQAVWVTLPVPRDAKPGVYRAQLLLTFNNGGLGFTAATPLMLRVYPVQMKRPRLWVTNWFGVNTWGARKPAAIDSPEYWATLEGYARSMADHFQNVVWIAPLSLADYRVEPDGRLGIDFARFDRWVDLFKKAGVIGRIEGGHIGGRVKDWKSQFVVQIRRIKDGKVVDEAVDPSSPEAEKFHAQFLPALQKHLEDNGWLCIYSQHLADEPIAENKKTYEAIARLVRKYAPRLKIIEACHTKDLVGSIDVWVPMLNFLHEDFAHYQARQKAGEEVWTYTCVLPQGEYANRFIEQPLIKTRLLHWINYRYGVTGYLHWGFNWWTTEPFKQLGVQQEGGMYLPAGDSWLVYPGEKGLLDSIRFEAMRDGICDYELLSMLAERDPKLAMKLASSKVLDFDRYDTDVKGFRAARKELLQRLSEAR